MSEKAEFSRVVDTSSLEQGALVLDIEAEEAEKRALARRFSLVALPSLKARIRVELAVASNVVRLSGKLSAEVVQSCAVTLEPVTNCIEESFALEFEPLPLGSPISSGEPSPGLARTVLVSPDEGDPPDPLIDERIDAGEVVAEHLALALEMYPRHPAARQDQAFVWTDRGDQGDDQGLGTSTGPFSVLERLK